MATRLYTNNAASTLASAITAASTSLTVATGDGAKFPAITGSDWFVATLQNGTTVEVVKVTARTTDTLTITRAQESTASAAFPAGSKVELRATAASFTAPAALPAAPYVKGDLLYATDTTVFTTLADVAAGAYLRAGGVGAAPVWTTLTLGQCRLTKSGANLLLSPFNGNKLIVNSVEYAIPDAGITLAVGAALTEGGVPGASTTYFIYAYSNSGTLTLQASATGHATQAGTGVEIRSGDATRTLVGQARTTAGTAWADSTSQIFVLSYFNRRSKSGQNFFSASRTTTSAPYVELNTEIRVEFLTWADEAVEFGAGGAVSNNTNADGSYTSLGFDGLVTVETASIAQNPAGSTLNQFPVGLAGSIGTLAEGYHYATLLGGVVTGGTASWLGGSTVGQRTAIAITVRG